MVEGCRTIGKRSGSETSIANSSARTRGSIALAGSLSRQEKQQAVQRWIVQIVFSPSTPRKSGIEASEPHRGQWGAVIASRLVASPGSVCREIGRASCRERVCQYV